MYSLASVIFWDFGWINLKRDSVFGTKISYRVEEYNLLTKETSVTEFENFGKALEYFQIKLSPLMQLMVMLMN